MINASYQTSGITPVTRHPFVVLNSYDKNVHGRSGYSRFTLTRLDEMERCKGRQSNRGPEAGAFPSLPVVTTLRNLSIRREKAWRFRWRRERKMQDYLDCMSLSYVTSS
jgi:hypothetical protein